MKNTFAKLVISVLIIILPTLFYGQNSGFIHSYVILDNGSGNTSLDLHYPSEANDDLLITDFTNATLGTIGTTVGTLLLNGGQNTVWKCASTDNITSGWLYYTIYPTGSRPAIPSFSSINLGTNISYSPGTVCGVSSQDEEWITDTENINLLNGLASGNHTLEVYTSADYTKNSVAAPNPHYVNNNGANFTTTFTADTPPSANCFGTLTVELDATGNATITAADIDNGSFDDFDTPTLSIDINTFDCSDIGTPVTVTLTAEDSLGQNSTCTTIVSVTSLSHTLSPVTVDCNGTLTTPTIIDACAGSLVGTTSDTLSFVEGGSTIITWTFNHGNGNYTTATQVYNYDDTTNPATPTLSAVTIGCDGALTAPTTTDSCAGIITGTTSDSLTYIEDGSTTINWTFNDGHGNSTTATQIYYYDDTSNPIAICQNITIPLNASGNVTISPADIDNGSSDNCGISSMTLDNASFTCSDLGVNTVTLFVRDTSNNLSTCTATVTVTDPADNASVSISANNNTICQGENGQFTATPLNGGINPVYNWFINNVSQGNNSPNFVPFTPLNDNDVVYVQMQSSLSSCNTPKQSNSITINVNPSPLVSGPSSLCLGNNSNLSPATSGWVSNTALATVDNFGVVTAISPGNATFTYTDSNGCSSNLTITINNSTAVTAPTSICVNETSNLSPNSGGTWSSTNNTRATVTNSGEITGIAPGLVKFIYTDANGCITATNQVEILVNPLISSVTASENLICNGESSILTANVQGAGINNEVIVNYNFNSGSNYASLDGQEVPGVNCDITHVNMYYRNGSGTATQGSAYSPEIIAGNALSQLDNQWGNEGFWRFTIGGSNLSTYQNFSLYFQTKRATEIGTDKYVYLYYRVNGTGNLIFIDKVLINNTISGTQWQEVVYAMPTLANNPNQLEFIIGATDGYTSSVGQDPSLNPNILIDNVQVRASNLPDSFTYSWSSNTGINSGLPIGSDTPSSSNSTISVNPTQSTEYTVTAHNSNGCTETDVITVNVLESPNITIGVNYCPTDDLSTAQDESNMVQLVASSTTPVSTWEWQTTPIQTGSTIYVDNAGFYQVNGTSANGCTDSGTIRVAQERIFNGNFSEIAATTDGDFGPDIFDNLNALGFDYDEDYVSPFTNGYRYVVNPVLDQNMITVTTDSGPLNTIFRSVNDHTGDAEAQFLAVNGGSTPLVVWRQEIPVEPGIEYYYSFWGIDLSDTANTSLNPSDLRFRINGILVGPTLDLVKGNDWERIYDVWNSGTETSAIVEIININTSPQGNNFGIDDVSFATLSTFISLTSPTGTDNQIICQNTPIQDITYDVGGGLNAPTITSTPALPAGLTTSFDGLKFTISGIPTEFGTFNYTITTDSSCNQKSSSGTITINEAPAVTIQNIVSPICSANGSVSLNSTVSGSATSGTWSTSGIGNFTGVSADGTTAVYNFGANEIGTINLTFTSNTPASTCTAASDTITFEITENFNANAGADINNSSISCANTTVTLNANNVVGQWTVTSGQLANTYQFSDASSNNSTFTGESGETYTLQWEAINTSPCGNTTDTTIITFADCGNNLVFDGSDDYINFEDNYVLNNTPFSIEAWIKLDNVSGTKTIISKRNSDLLNSGYDLSVINNRLYFRWNNQSMAATQVINTSKWYHVAITFNGTNTYAIYIDGFLITTNNSGASPIINNSKSLIGAMDKANSKPVNYFEGGIDEVRFWNTTLTQEQIREMMNQEIEVSGINEVSGVVIPLEISGGLQWNNLIGYYQMNDGTQANIANGRIQDIATSSPVDGKLNNMTSVQTESAPIPYISVNNTNWDSQNTWQNGSVQQIPNSTVNSINGLAQTWNIVITQHNVLVNRATSITLSGLRVDNNKLSITNNLALRVNKYLKIDGVLDLEDESQLLQPSGSIVDYTGTGNLERDQQGSSNLYNYNYWSSPVSDNGTTFTIANVMYDGTTAINPQPLNWTANNNANPLTTPISISKRWLYLYENYLDNSYADWNSINENYNIPIGLGYSMKGSGSASANQNYTFVGQPNNGTITSPVSGNFQALVGNPYPSAIDAVAFINDNSGVLLDGTLYFWEHAASNNSHNLSAYEGGYAARNLTHGVPAVSSPEINGQGNSNKIPGRYVPVAQGFFVTGNGTGGMITFNNNQRVFAKESDLNSFFLRSANTPSEDSNTSQNEDNNQFIRLDFITPDNATRQLVIGFMDNTNATDGIDYGYDGLNTDSFPNDMSFNIEGEKYIIQGVGSFDATKSYPLDIDVSNGGNIEIRLNSLENFSDNRPVFIYDALEQNYISINNQNFQTNLEPGNYSSRFYLVFQEDETLSTIKNEFENVNLKFLLDTDEIYIKTPPSINIKQLYLINVAGQTIASWNTTNLAMSNEIKIPIKNISEGTYIIKAETQTGTFNKKIIIKY